MCNRYRVDVKGFFLSVVLGKGPFRLITFKNQTTLLAASRSSGSVFLQQVNATTGSTIAGILSQFMMTPGLSRARPHGELTLFPWPDSTRRDSCHCKMIIIIHYAFALTLSAAITFTFTLDKIRFIYFWSWWKSLSNNILRQLFITFSFQMSRGRV